MKKENIEALIVYRINKAKETFNEIDILVENELWNTAINRLYYACYYAVSALLIKHEIKAQSHAGIRKMFGLHFIKTEIISKNIGNFFSEIFDMRQTGDYDDFFDYTEEEVRDLIEPANELICKIELLIKIK